MAPWNYPYLIAVNALVPGLIAGNAVILKHATQTLQVGERLAEAFHKRGWSLSDDQSEAVAERPPHGWAVSGNQLQQA